MHPEIQDQFNTPVVTDSVLVIIFIIYSGLDKEPCACRLQAALLTEAPGLTRPGSNRCLVNILDRSNEIILKHSRTLRFVII